MENQVLSIEQMQELEGLGVDISKASMCWYEKSDKYVLCNEGSLLSGYFSKIPTFTLQDILDILPKHIETEYKREVPYKELVKQGRTPKRDAPPTYEYFTEEYTLDTNLVDEFCYFQQGYFSDDVSVEIDTKGNTLLEAAFKMLKCCKEKNYI